MGRRKQTKVDKTPYKLRRRRLADFMDLLIAEYKGQSRSGYANLRTAKGVLLSFRPDCRLCDIDKRFCTDYADRLKGGYLTKDGKPIEKATCRVAAGRDR